MNELQAQELENIEQDERFEVTDLDSANWVFKKLDAITTKENEINELADKEIERIKSWQEKEVEKLQGSKDYLQSLVIEYFRIEKEKDSKFKLNTPYGKVTSRKGSKVIQVSNEQEVINQLEKRGFDNYVKVTKKLSQSDIKKDFNVTENGTLIDANGEVLEGASIVEKPTSYTVKVGE
ncbi:TPA: host-nuclease inhibitor Gam family protein [Staphylococcus aureus]|nr:host-nuclease inhibitor Gam family protein [Staphylococcus aureus]HCZ8831706.1 host-nuclease inhibitor Gam family protein [Staphylococcus aureus]HDI7448459.1 host-nuclease inhibitor Gam family protein [Staphylococcus aureus]HDP4433154.1 host-nuclease inhibitor Gam family protein [Staphylococcus aureus]